MSDKGLVNTSFNGNRIRPCIKKILTTIRRKKVSNFSVLDAARKQFKPEIPKALKSDISAITFEELDTDFEVSDQEQIKIFSEYIRR